MNVKSLCLNSFDFFLSRNLKLKKKELVTVHIPVVRLNIVNI